METHPFYEEDTFIQIYDNSECKDDNIIGFSRSDNNKFYMKKNGAWEETEQIELRDYWAEIFDSNTEISTTDCIINTTTKYNNQNYVVFDFMGQLDEGFISENNTEIEETDVSDLIDEIVETNNENSLTKIKTKEEILTEELIGNLKTKRTTEIDWKSLKCKNQMELDYNIWFDDQSYIKVDIQGYEIILSERKTYTFEGVKRIVLSDFYGNGNNLILDRETLNYSSSDQSDLGECRVLFTLEEFLNPLVNTIIEGSQKNKF